MKKLLFLILCLSSLYSCSEREISDYGVSFNSVRVNSCIKPVDKNCVFIFDSAFHISTYFSDKDFVGEKDVFSILRSGNYTEPFYYCKTIHFTENEPDWETDIFINPISNFEYEVISLDYPFRDESVYTDKNTWLCTYVKVVSKEKCDSSYRHCEDAKVIRNKECALKLEQWGLSKLIPDCAFQN